MRLRIWGLTGGGLMISGEGNAAVQGYARIASHEGIGLEMLKEAVREYLPVSWRNERVLVDALYFGGIE